MIKRIYIHNFKTFINFETTFDDFNLLLGPNGSGKTALFEVLRRLRLLVCEKAEINTAFPPSCKTRGISGADNTLHLEIDIEDSAQRLFRYILEIEYNDQSNKQRIVSERLSCDNTPLFSARMGEAQLYRDNGSQGPGFPMDWTQSGVGFLMPSSDNTKLIWFRERLSKIWILRIVPELIREESRAESRLLEYRMENFADWYRHLILSSPDVQYEVSEDLKERMPGFKMLRLKEAGEAKILYASFEGEGKSGTIDIPFSQLSEGQKVLIGLYASLNGFVAENESTLCFDEPENFLALPEVQPWLDRLYEESENNSRQVMLISHHPRVINFLAANKGKWLERLHHVGPTRIAPIGNGVGAALSLDQMLERGWISDS